MLCRAAGPAVDASARQTPCGTPRPDVRQALAIRPDIAASGAASTLADRSRVVVKQRCGKQCGAFYRATASPGGCSSGYRSKHFLSLSAESAAAARRARMSSEASRSSCG